jgi:hypothetical protein
MDIYTLRCSMAMSNLDLASGLVKHENAGKEKVTNHHRITHGKTTGWIFRLHLHLLSDPAHP